MDNNISPADLKTKLVNLKKNLDTQLHEINSQRQKLEEELKEIVGWIDDINDISIKWNGIKEKALKKINWNSPIDT